MKKILLYVFVLIFYQNLIDAAQAAAANQPVRHVLYKFITLEFDNIASRESFEKLLKDSNEMQVEDQEEQFLTLSFYDGWTMYKINELIEISQFAIGSQITVIDDFSEDDDEEEDEEEEINQNQNQNE